MASGPFQHRTHRSRELPPRPPSARTARDILAGVLGAPDRAGQVDLAGELLCGGRIRVRWPAKTLSLGCQLHGRIAVAGMQASPSRQRTGLPGCQDLYEDHPDEAGPTQRSRSHRGDITILLAWSGDILPPAAAEHIGGYACGLSPRFSHAPRSARGVDALAPRAPARP
jgi:hypothetical protein